MIKRHLANVELSPFALTELPKKPIDDLWLMGGFPDGGILNGVQYPQWQRNYLDLLAMRDLPIWGLPVTTPVTKRFFKMLAASHGSIWNASMIGKSMGLSYHTVNSYLDFLEQIYLIRSEDLIAQPWVRFSWEGWVIEQILTTFSNRGVHCEPFYFRTADGYALDLAKLKF